MDTPQFIHFPIDDEHWNHLQVWAIMNEAAATILLCAFWLTNPLVSFGYFSGLSVSIPPNSCIE